MTVQDHLRTLLESNKNVFLSGEEIARRLGVSRNAVWKAIKALQAGGYPIQAVPNRGYCLAASSDVLSESGIRQYLTPEAQSLDLRVYDSVDSTNLVLRKLANEGAAEGTVVIAAEQSGGRGRKGRNFYSPQGTGVYVSLLLKPQIAPDDATLITTTAAVAVCDAVEALSGEPATIKWVNDVFMRGKKICGILTEGSFDMESGQFEYAILGTGINVDGVVRRGASGSAGEIGYLEVPRSAIALDPAAETFTDLLGGPAIARLLGHPAADFTAALKELPQNEPVLAELAVRVVMLVDVITAVLDPACVVLGGPTGLAGGDRLAELVQNRIQDDSARVRVSQAGDEPVLQGARQLLVTNIRERLEAAIAAS